MGRVSSVNYLIITIFLIWECIFDLVNDIMR